MITDNIQNIRSNVSNILTKTDKAIQDITIVAVTKTIDVDEIRLAVMSGMIDVGENRVQEILRKYDMLSKDIRWHMIGQLQRNKVKYIIDKVFMIHSLDSLSLAAEINKHAQKADIIMKVLIQVNISKEASKSGVYLENILPFIHSLKEFKHIQIQGLMTIVPYVDNQELVRPYFKRMKALFDELDQMDYSHMKMKYLSMGMTHDFQVALQEGSNMIRIGTGIFGKRKKEES